ncbi:hypothetical protein GCM10007417_13560 [Glycocaulis alkaliphilus]|nr:hypothetical protein GCM10007417_13560 [Glycocaulis alkaliphilus]
MRAEPESVKGEACVSDAAAMAGAETVTRRPERAEARAIFMMNLAKLRKNSANTNRKVDFQLNHVAQTNPGDPLGSAGQRD